MSMTIGLEDLKLTLKLGVDPHERTQTQDIFVDIQVEADIKRAMKQDKLEFSVDYQEIATRLEQFVQGKECHLIETLAHEMMDHLFEHLKVDYIWIRVKKPQAVALANYAYVELDGFRDEDL